MRPRSLNLTAFEHAEGLTLLNKESKKRVELKATNNGSTLSLYDNTETERGNAPRLRAWRSSSSFGSWGAGWRPAAADGGIHRPLSPVVGWWSSSSR